MLTEGCRSLLPSDGYTIEGSNDWGYEVSDPARRKVILWSRYPLREPDVTGSPGLPTGRFVSGIASLSGSSIKIIGVCIPWSGAHVRTGRKDRELWQDHNTFIKHLSPIIKTNSLPLVLAGDFNQRLPRQRQPLDSYKLIVAALQDLKIHTEGFGDPALIDHIATTREFGMTSLRSISRDYEGTRLSDHDGVTAAFEIAGVA